MDVGHQGAGAGAGGEGHGVGSIPTDTHCMASHRRVGCLDLFNWPQTGPFSDILCHLFLELS
jgi:hypothetical protein